MPPETTKLSIESKLEQLGAIDAAVKDVAAKMGFGERDAHGIELAVHEAVINAILHGNRGDAGKRVEVEIAVEADGLVIEVRDRGAGFDPAGVPSPLADERL